MIVRTLAINGYTPFGVFKVDQIGLLMICFSLIDTLLNNHEHSQSEIQEKCSEIPNAQTEYIYFFDGAFCIVSNHATFGRASHLRS